MPKSAATYRSTAYKLWRENKELKRKLQGCQQTIVMLRNSAQEQDRVNAAKRVRHEALQESFEKLTRAFSEELKCFIGPKIKSTARKSTAAKDYRVPVNTSESSSEFESPESDVDSVDLAHEKAQEKARKQAEAAPDTPASPDAI